MTKIIIEKEIMTHKFPNGAEMTAPIDVLLQYAIDNKFPVSRELIKELPAGYHISEDGLVEISNMNTHHIINAMTKVAREYFEDIKPKRGSELDLLKYLEDFQSMVLNTNIDSYFRELVERTKK